MKRYRGEMSGVPVRALIKVLEQSPAAVSRLLEVHELQTIDEDAWYDLDLVRTLFSDVERVVGSRALYNVGVNLMMSIPLREATTPLQLLSNIDAGYRSNVRGEDLGAVSVTPEGERSARIIFSSPFPCHLDQGLCAGGCRRFGEVPLVEHASGACRDKGALVCNYRVSW